MKKNLLAIAVAGAMAVPTAGFAQGPTLYGQAHISLDYIDNNNDNALRTSSNTSRIGVKGAHELTDSLSAIYLFEWEVDVGNGSQGLKNRNQYAGFKHDAFGTLVMGRHDTPGKVIGRKVDLFWSSQLGQNRAVTTGNFSDVRANQVVGYISPDFGPVHAFLAYVADTNGNGAGTILPNADDNDNNAFSGALIYDQGGLFVGFSYDWFNDKGSVAQLGGAQDPDAPQNYRLAAKYGWNNFTVAGLGQYNNNIFGTGVSQWLLGGGLAYTMGKNVLKGQVYYANEQDDLFNAAGQKIEDTDALLIGLGWDHNFSKSTAAYLTLAAIAPGDNAAQAVGSSSGTTLYNLGGPGHGFKLGVVDDEWEWGVSAGYRIKF
jgi:predicted porin